MAFLIKVVQLMTRIELTIITDISTTLSKVLPNRMKIYTEFNIATLVGYGQIPGIEY